LNLRNISILAVLNSTTKSVRLKLFSSTLAAQSRVENSAPFAIAGDDSGNIRAMNFRVGTQTIKATPFSNVNAQGPSGAVLQIQIKIQY